MSVGVELTFELPDNAKECFYQEIQKNVSSTLEFQVNISTSLFKRHRERVPESSLLEAIKDSVHFCFSGCYGRPVRRRCYVGGTKQGNHLQTDENAI